MIVADTGAVLALVNADDRHHRSLRRVYEAAPDDWVLPWAILPEVDYLLATQLSVRVELAFLADLAAGAWPIEWRDPRDLERAHELAIRHKSLQLGLVDGVVIAVAERLAAEAIATLDLRDFAAVEIRGQPRLLPRDL